MASINTFVLKIASFCNLNCTYCYVFNAGDTSYLRRPKVMPLTILDAAISKITSYAQEVKLTHVYLVLHGGEPMLAGKDWFKEFARLARARESETLRFSLSMQTNGVLLDDEWLDLLCELGIGFGISLDGPEAVNDRARVNHAGAGSYHQVRAALDRIAKHPQAARAFGGLLCVIDPAENGRDIYRHFRSLGVTKIDFLLPYDYNWDKIPEYFSTGQTPLADYLIPIFDDWWQENNPEIKIRMFEVILSLIFGRERVLDSLGGFPLLEAVVEADGSLEPLDVLRECGDGFTQIGLNVNDHSLTDFVQHPLIKLSLRGREGLCATCQACSLVDICGGGYLPQRYGQGRGFDNPSIHCRDLWKLITHMVDAATASCRAANSSLAATAS